MIDIVARLARHRSIGSAPASEHEWLAANGVLKSLEVGEVVTAKGQPAQNLLVIFEGDLVIRVDRGAGAHKVMEWVGGDLGGNMPYSRGASPPNDVVAEKPTELLSISKDLFPQMIRECPTVTSTLVHAMLDRARQFTSSELRDEKLISLGKLSAGLAHELNNPASAVMRSAKMLTGSIDAAEQAARQLATSRLSDEQFALIEATRSSCDVTGTTTQLSAVARADREGQIADWLVSKGADEDCALALADSSITMDALDKLATNVTDAALDAALRWITACCVVRALSAEIETGATRLSHLVGAVKGFSYMDHAPTPEPVDIRRGVSDTITLLGAKTRAKSAKVTVTFADDLPLAYAVGAELNQVWMNLIDNALDAIPEGGNVSVAATHELNDVVVRITDDGPGIPDAVKEKIFDPFFTTKGVGEGSGMGLDIVKRLLKRHEGEIDVETRPGMTQFQVRLPVPKQ
jgi:signal transduction histidine kinase